MLDEVAFYSSALSSNSILAHYQAFVTNMPPVITTQPVGGTFLAGIPLNLSVQVLGQNLTYQWYFGTTAIADATNATLSIPSLATTDAGSYHVVVTCTAPVTNVTSGNATIAVISSLPPTLVAYQTAVKNTPGLISYYTFDQDNANDNVGSHNGTLAGTATLAPGIGGAPGLGLHLDGNGWVQLGRVPDFDFASGTGSAEAWVQAAWPSTFGASRSLHFRGPGLWHGEQSIARLERSHGQKQDRRRRLERHFLPGDADSGPGHQLASLCRRLGQFIRGADHGDLLGWRVGRPDESGFRPDAGDYPNIVVHREQRE